jgi:undecaprenyl-diphosphatase
VLELLRRVGRDVNKIDRDLVRASARIPRGPLDPGLKALTTAANHSVLWLTIAAVLASRKGVTRRAAFRGVLAIAGASFTANVVVKPVAGRVRPARSTTSLATWGWTGWPTPPRRSRRAAG